MLICLLYFFCTFCVFVQFQVVMLHEKDSARWRAYLEGLMFEVPDKCLFQVTFCAAENLGW